MKARILGVLGCCVLAACGPTSLKPATLDTRNEACASCRMAVSNPKLAAQLVLAGEEPRFFDDIGCLAAYLREHPAPAGSAAFVADHQSGSWIPANAAVFTRVDQLETPMGSHLVAHSNIAARDADGSVRTGRAVTPDEIFGKPK